MQIWGEITEWLTGGDRRYLLLLEALRGDVGWALALVGVSGVLLIGYGLIALEWRRCECALFNGVRRRALRRVRRTLLIGAVGGYVLLPIAMIWPGWRLYVLVLAGVALVVWRLAWRRRDVRLLCRAVGRSRISGRAEARRKSFFLNALGHDLKNPLHGMTLQAHVAEALLTDRDIDGARHAMSMMRHCIDEANDLLNDFLEIGRLDSPADEPFITTFDAARVLRGVADTHQPMAAQKNIGLEVELPETLWVASDRVRLERICQNLLANAIKYTNTGKVVIRGGGDGRSMTLEVEDTGPGISPEVQEHLFDVFYRAPYSRTDHPSGHGLGLAIVDRLVHSLGGRIDLDSQVGVGTCFRVTFPETIEAGSEYPSSCGPVERSIITEPNEPAHPRD